MDVKRYRFTVEYDGTEYNGFQVQAQGERTIQGELERALTEVLGTPTAVTGAGRTDAGVHAAGQVVAFDAATTIPVGRIPYPVNAALPSDIVVRDCREVPPRFHPRKDALRKTYRYTYWVGDFPSPFWRRYCHPVGVEPDLELMKAAAEILTGRHDFRAFRSTGSSAVTTERTLTRLDLERDGPLLHIWLEADGFLYNMARIIAGTLYEVGCGRLSPRKLRAALSTGERTLTGPTAPAKGLCLVRVEYGAGSPNVDTPARVY